MPESVFDRKARVRPPRVHITYDVETGGAIELKELPVRDGRDRRPVGQAGRGAAEAQGPQVRRDRPRQLRRRPDGHASHGWRSRSTTRSRATAASSRVELKFEKLADFRPENVVQQVAPLREAAGGPRPADGSARQDRRQRPARGAARTSSATTSAVRKKLQRRAGVEARTSRDDRRRHEHGARRTRLKAVKVQELETLEAGDLLEQIIATGVKPRDDEERGRAQDLIGKFVEQCSIRARSSTRTWAHDQRAHRGDRRAALEAAQRDPAPPGLPEAGGLVARPALPGDGHGDRARPQDPGHERLARRTCSRTSRRAAEFDQSALFKKVYEEEFGTFGGDPFGALVGDYEFDSGPQDIALLARISQRGGGGARPVHLGGEPAAVRLGQLHRDARPARPDQDLRRRIPSTPSGGRSATRRTRATSSLRAAAHPDAAALRPRRRTRSRRSTTRRTSTARPREVPLGQRRLRLRRPAHRRRSPSTTGARRSAASRAAAWSRACRSTPSRPTRATWRRSARPRSRSPTAREGALRPRLHRAAPLQEHRLRGVLRRQVVQKPKKYNTDEANANAQLSSQIPYIMATSRFAHYLKAMMRDKIGSFMRSDGVRDVPQPLDRPSTCARRRRQPEEKAQHPLREARVDVIDDPASRALQGGRLPAAALPARRAERLAAPRRRASRRPRSNPRSEGCARTFGRRPPPSNQAQGEQGCSMGSNIHLRLDNIPGDSQDGGHAGEIDVHSVSHGMSQATGDWSSGGSATGGNPNFSDLSTSKARVSAACGGGVGALRLHEDRVGAFAAPAAALTRHTDAAGQEGHGSPGADFHPCLQGRI